MAKLKVPGLDAVRFATAFIVMLFHMCYWRNGQVAPDSDAFGSAWWFGWVGVEIFFTISGFVIAFSTEGVEPKKYALSRVVRLVPMVWICASIALVATLALSSDVPPDILRRYAATMVLAPFGHHVDVVYWTLTVEVSFYLLVFLVIRFRDFDFMLRLLLWIGLVSTVFNILTVLAQAGVGPARLDSYLMLLSTKHSTRLLLLRHGCFFALGSFLWSRLTAHRLRRAGWLAWPLIVGCTFEVYFQGRSHALQFPESTFSMWTPLWAWWIGLALIYGSSLPSVNARLSTGRLPQMLRTIGLLTFPLYLLHNNCGTYLRDRLLDLGHSQWMATCIAMPAVLLLSYLVSAKVDPPFSDAFRVHLRRIAHMLRAHTATARFYNRLFVRS